MWLPGMRSRELDLKRYDTDKEASGYLLRYDAFFDTCMFSGSMARDRALMAKGREMVLQRIASYSAHCEKLARYRRRAERHRATRAWVANLGGRVKSLIKRPRSSER